MLNIFSPTWMRTHGTAAGFGLMAIAVLAVSTASAPALLGNLRATVVDIGIEHDKPLSLLLEVGVLDGMAVAEFFSESPETILISVPSTWVRREVKNAPIHTVTSELPSLGFTRWKLPARAGISFKIATAPESLVLHNPTGVQMKLDLVLVNLETEEVDRDILLIQGDTVKLW
jgi:hypothetical protein